MRTRSSLYFSLLIAFAAGIGVTLALRTPLDAALHSEATAAAHAAAGSRATQTYYCPMHPSYRSDHPGNCPVCNMKLIPLDAGLEAGDPSNVAGHATVTLRPERQQLIGVQSAEVERKPAVKTLRAVGRVEYDERKLSAVSLKYGGWIADLHVNSTGQSVANGEPLFSLYSPELYEAQRAYLLARAALAGTPAGSLGDGITTSAREKLFLWDMNEEQIRALEALGQAERLSTVLSRTHGVVLRREVVAGQRVEAGMTLFELADLATVWIHAALYETELPGVRVGLQTTIELESLPGATLTGQIVYIYPDLDETTRTARVRVEADNTDGRLKPGMYATVSIAVDLGQQLVIDDDAILDTGRRKLVFVDLGEGRFEPREVTLAHRGDGQAVVLTGLEEHERVITSGNFLVDSESRLKAALAQHTSGAHEHH